MRPKVSVIVPIYNVEKYLQKCIESIINQTLKEIEIILVNDGSTDSSGLIADSYAKKDDRIKIIHKKNGGQGEARNLGIDSATGEYIGFVDSDDWIDLNMYDELYNRAISKNVDIAICGRRLYSEDGKLESQFDVNDRLYLNVDDNIINYLVEDLFYPHTVVVYNKIYKYEIIKKYDIKFKDVKEVGSEDVLFNYSLLFNVKSILSITSTYHNQLMRQGSTAREYKIGVMNRTANLIQNIYEYSNSINRCDIAKVAAPIMLIFFQQWNYNLLKTYGKEKLRYLIEKEHNLVSNKYFKKAEKEFIFNKNITFYLMKMGYSKKGIFFLKIYTLFSLLGLNKFAARFRVII